MNRRRLRKLADFLEDHVIEKWFDMQTIADDGFDVRECGTAACCIGWTPMAFPRSGIKFNRRCYNGKDETGGYDLEVVYQGHEGFPAVEAFYDLTVDEGELLFEPSNYPRRRGRKIPRKTVIKRIRDFCDGTIKAPASESYR